tara:strand:+ start:27082 stop:27972 length:891 start_codon:yes stop_codon:yes gene_type:complete
LRNINSPKEQLDNLTNDLIDPLAFDLANKVSWHYINGFSKSNNDLYPIVLTGEGPPLLMIHGFDSCFLEFRRLVPLLRDKYKLIIPDLYGFGFCPRPKSEDYGMESIVSHLTKILGILNPKSPIGVIGASMGGAIALELAKENHSSINHLLLISPAGLTNKQTKVPWPFNELGVCLLRQPFIRKSLCRQAFAKPEESVGPAEEQIASIHLNVDGWHRSLSTFARNGGVAIFGKTIPSHSIEVIWGANDRIINKENRVNSMNILKKELKEIDECGHLPHLDKPNLIADIWLSRKKNE